MSDGRAKNKTVFSDRFIFHVSVIPFSEPADDMARADVGAVAALDALVVVDDGEVVDDLDGVGRALALALHAADAAVIAYLHDSGALVLIRAGGHDSLALGQELDDALGAGIRAGAAADAL